MNNKYECYHCGLTDDVNFTLTFSFKDGLSYYESTDLEKDKMKEWGKAKIEKEKWQDELEYWGCSIHCKFCWDYIDYIKMG